MKSQQRRHSTKRAFLIAAARRRRRRKQVLHRLEQLETRALLTAAPIMDQFLVNETSALAESPAAVSVIETSGNFVATWTSFEQAGGDESGLGVYAQRFAADGSAIAPAFLVNTEQTAGDQLSPQVATDAVGNFVIVWQGDDGDGAGIFGQRFAADGTTVGSMFQINADSSGDQQAPDIAMDNAGNAIVAWQSNELDGVTDRTYAKQYDSSGIAGGEFAVNSVMVGNQTSPSVAVSRVDGNFIVAWEGEVIGDETSIEVFAQQFAVDASPVGSTLQVNTTTLRDQVSPDVAMDLAGNFVATWTSEGIPGSGSDVFAQRFDASGAAAGPEFRVNETVLQGQHHSQVAADADGDFFINWQSSHQDAFSWGIFGRAYGSDGTPLTTEIQVNTYSEQPQTSPTLSSNTQGQVVAVWLGLDPDHTPAVHAQSYQLPDTVVDFSVVGGEVVLANYLGLEDTSAAAAVDENRQFFVVWQSYGEDGSGLGILGRRLNEVGEPLGEAFVINTTTAGNQMNPDIAMDAAGNAVAVWESADQDADGHGIYAQRFNPAGDPVGSEFLVNSVELGHQVQPAIAMNPDNGDFVVIWQSPDESLEGIFGQRYLADGSPIGASFQVNTETDLDQVSPAVSMNTAGEFAVAWVSDHRSLIDPENDSEKSIFVQWYDSSGVATGAEQLVHSIVKEYQAQEYPDLALDADGNMIVVWQSITQDGGAWGVFGRQLTADKTLIGDAEFQINQTTPENQRRATVVSDAEGNFTVSWQSDLQDQSAIAIVSRQYNSDATPETDEMLVNTWEMGPQILPVMAMTPAGDYGIFWDGQGLSRSEGIHGRIYEEGYVPPPPHLTVLPNGDQFLVGEAAGLEPSFPAVAVIETTGNYVAAWTSFEQPDNDESGLGVYAQQFEPDGTPIGAAILVNTTYTTDDQTHPGIAADADGNFVVVWQSLGQDGDGEGIFAQRYQQSLEIGGEVTAVGGVINVNELTTGDQSHPTIAMDNSGNFVIAWQGDSGNVDDGLDIFARRYDSDGTALEMEEFRVNTTSAGNQSAPTVARDRTGTQFVIGWQTEVVGDEEEIDVEVVGKLYASDATVLLDEFGVNTTAEHDQVGPSVAMAADGAFVFAWTAEGQIASGADVYARRFDSSGTGLEDNFLVNETTGQGQQYPAVAIDADGNWIVSWQSSHQDGFSWGIFAKAYDVDLNVVAAEFQVNSNIQGPQTNPAVNANSQGDAVVTWLGLDEQHQPAIHAQRVLLPTAVDSEFTIGPEGEVVLNNYVALEEAPASAAVNANGDYVATWQSYGQDGSGLGVYARRFDADGVPLGDPFLVTNTTAGNQSQPDVAVDASGAFIITWQSDLLDGQGYDIYARRFDANGDAIADEFRVNKITFLDQEKPAVAMNPDGAAVIVWQAPEEDASLGIFGRRLSPDGNPTGDDFHLNTFTALDQVSPTIAMNDQGEVVVAWVSDHRAEFDPTDSEKSIFVQWYNAAGVSSGEEVLVHSIQAEFEAQELPDLDIDNEGNFVIVWQSINQDGNTWGVFARQFLADKTPVQPIEFQVNQTVMAPQRHATVGLDGDGNFAIAWQSHAQDSSGPGVFARVYDAAAVAQTDEFQVPTWDQGPQTNPIVAMTPEGDFGVYWTGHGVDRVEGVQGRLYSIYPEVTGSSIGLYQPQQSRFYLRETLTNGTPDWAFTFGVGGTPGWTPIAGDWNNDDFDTIGLYQPDRSRFHLKDSLEGGDSDHYFTFGPAGNVGWIPLAGDWNGDGVDTIGLYQPDRSIFHLKDSFSGGPADHYFAFGPQGNVGWIPLAGDWNGDGIDTIGLYQPDLSIFHLKDSFAGGNADHYFKFGPSGNAGWTPLAGDWNSDAIDTVGLYQPDISLFHLKDSFSGGRSDHYVTFVPSGPAGWIPIAGDWNGPESSAPPLVSTFVDETMAEPSSVPTATSINDPPISTLDVDSDSESDGGSDSVDEAAGETTSPAESSLQLLDEVFAEWV